MHVLDRTAVTRDKKKLFLSSADHGQRKTTALNQDIGSAQKEKGGVFAPALD